MDSYYDIIYLMGAMLVFSLLTIQTNRMFQINNRIQINSEIEYNAISVAQDQIDKLRWIKNEGDFNSFVNDFPKDIPMAFEEETLYFNVDIQAKDANIPGSNIINKHITVSVTNKYLKTNESEDPGSTAVKLEFIKSFN